ncbi:MAG: electron transfer flavoprotein subunit alpha/FixB family protein [Chloroflexi bacterium]|nr:electron transfer flavoprotein subunit alpha/FixB family protein [Chloroflexota bacterium]
MASGILVIGEAANGALVPITAELLGGARRLGAGTITCAFIGSGVAALAGEAAAFGADEVLVAEDSALAEYNSDAYLQATLKLIEQAAPSVVLFGQTNLGRDLAPRLAFRLNTGVIMDCVELAMQDGRLHATRPCYGGNALAVNMVRSDPQIATVRAKSQDPLERDGARQAQVTNVDAAIDASAVRIKVTGRKGMAAEGVRLEDAEIVVSGGRGLGGPENFAVIEELARALGAAVGASRTVCDLGWRPVSDQVGLTGKVVSPTLYIAVAISGASQHMAGCSGSKNIVAINKDADANIFKTSRFGIVEDYAKVIGPLTEAIKKAKGA